MLNTIIVDDEQHCIDRINSLIQQHSNTLNIVATCNDVDDAYEKITSLKPDVVFLDVQLHQKTGFDLLKKFTNIEFEIIFTTAFNSYAVEAFRYSALDYLLKPVDPELFRLAVLKLQEKSNRSNLNEKISTLFHNLEGQSARSKKIAIPTLQGLDFILVSNIIRCQSDGGYTNIFLAGKKKLVVTKTLKHIESLLDHHHFFRTHQSHLINLNFAEKYLRGSGGFVLMSDGSQIEVAVRRKEEFLRRFTDLN